jgi:hypothetical protein
MLFSHSLTAFSRPDLLGFGLILMKKQDPFAFISCESRIHSQSDLGLCKDVCFPILFFFLFLFYGFVILCFSISLTFGCAFVADLLQSKGSFFLRSWCYSIEFWGCT